jgi:hypothetical protein
MAARGEAFHVMHDKPGMQAGLASKEEVFLHRSGDGIVLSDLPTGPAMGDGVESMLAQNCMAIIDASGTVYAGVEHVQPIIEIVTK